MSSEFEIPDFYNPEDWEAAQEDKRYIQKPLGKWIYTQAEIGQVVIPKITEVVPLNGQDHSVMWVERVSVEQGKCNSCHQIVCDCVMDMVVEDVDKGNFSCQAVDKFIRWGADLTRRAKRLDVLIDFYRNIPAGLPIQEDRIAKGGDRVLETIIEDLLSETKLHPENWVGNRLSGSHTVTGLSHVFKQERRQTLEVLGEMQQAKVIELRENETVILRAA
ncbi:hypothetical protein KW789_00205 [Candidatus Saccharibacteria bacterium]|jgi:hypothetical protein|nr:hypothetical protein [Candidatus Saccharibacteria bacterium]